MLNTSSPHYTALYRCWYNMRRRCLDPKSKDYAFYGARGVTIHPDWDFFWAFYEWAISSGYVPGLTIDRRNVREAYGPDNCRWLTKEQNNIYRRDTKWLEAFGESKTLTQWERDPRCKVSRSTLYHRIRRGWTVERAITTKI